MRRLEDARGAPEDETRGTRLRVLLVEDSENDAVYLLQELRRGGYEPLCERVSTPEEMQRALEEARVRGEEWEVVVSDYYMPRFEAPDALALLRRLGYDTPFIVVSSKIGEEAAVGLMRAGAQDYIDKENMARLCPAIDRELRETLVRRERENAEGALEESEDGFRRLVEQAADAMLVYDLEGNFIDVNRSACEALGYSREELLGMSVRDVEAGVAEGELGRLWKEISASGPRTFDALHRRKDGTSFPVEVRVGVFELGGRPLVLALARDVTERKKAAQRREAQHSVSRILSRFDTLREAAPSLLEAIGAGLGWELGALWMVDESASVLRCREVWQAPSISAAEFEAVSRETSFTPGVGLPGRTWESGEPTWIEDVLKDANFPRSKAATREGLHGAFAFPVWIEGHVFGVLEFFSHRILPPDRDLLQTVAAVGNQIGQFIQRQISEERRREIEERYRVVAETASDVIVLIDEESRMLFINGAAENIFGHAREEMLGQELTMLMPEHLRDTHRAGLRRYLDTGRRHLDWNAIQLPGLHKSGAEISLEVSFGVFVKEGRRFFTGFIRDVTERRRAERQARFLTDLNHALQLLSDPSEVTTTATRLLGEHLDADRCAYGEVEADEDHFRITGDYTRGVPSIVGRFAMSQLGSEALRLMRANKPYVVADAEADERVTEVDLGAYRQTQIRAVVSVPLHRAGRFVAGMAVYQKTPRRWSPEEVELVATVTNRCWESLERSRAEGALRRSEERYRAVIEQSTEGLYLFDARTRRLEETNPAFQRMLGYTAEELMGMELHTLLAHPREEVEYNLRRTLEDGHRFVGERKYRRKDGTLVDVEASASVIRYGDREVVCALVRDITERKEAERRLGEVRDAERNRIARDLHDDILQDIVYALQEIQIAQITPPEDGDAALKDAAEALRRSVEGLRGSIFELRTESLSQSFVASLRALVDLNRRMSRNRYALELSVEEGFPSEISERAGRQLTRIFQEALANARRHANPRRVEIRLWREGENACMEVTDDGRGFDPSTPDVGVGRQSMRHRALELGGKLEVESAPERGTRVRVRVPVSRLSDAPPDGV